MTKHCSNCGKTRNHCHHKRCDKLPQPPTDTLIPLDGENCIACKDSKKLCQCHNANKYLLALSYDELCNKYINPSLDGYNGIVNPAALKYTVDPPLNVPPGQKGFNMVPDPVAYPIAPHYPPIANPIPLANRNVLVVGAAKNLGKAIANMFVSNGCNVVGTSRFPECYSETYPYPLLKLDVRFSNDVKKFFEKLMSEYFTNGQIDILVNLPGIQTHGTMYESNGDDLSDIFNNNICGYQRVVYHAIPFMRFSNQTRIISFGSIAGEFPNPIDGYTISKHALQMWNDCSMADALQRKALGISSAEPTFTLIEPGIIQSSIALYEKYLFADTDPFGLRVRGTGIAFNAMQSATTVTFPALACPQNPPPPPFVPPFSTCPCPAVPALCANVPELVAEAVHQIVMAPQPSVRYLIDAAPGALNFAPVVAAANILSADDVINNITASVVTQFYDPNFAALGQAILKDSFCNP